LILETTGINITHDRIIEISFLKVYPNGKEEVKSRRINPEIPIPPQATAIHGITDDDVKDCPTFKQIARSLAEQLEGCDLAGFNSSRFDVPMLAEEFLRAGVDFDMSKRKFVDVQIIFIKKNNVPWRQLMHFIVIKSWRMPTLPKLMPLLHTKY